MVNQYELILFDADDTLFDFQQSERVSFHQTAAEHRITENLPQLFSRYKEISASLWRKLELNEITKEKLRLHRFELLLLEYGLDACPLSMSEMYLSFLPKNFFLIEGAHDLCRQLSKKFKLGIVTNGIASVQEARLARSGLVDFVSFMVVSEECGYHKPDRRIFDHTLQRANGSPHKTLMVGDRLETDILGAQNAQLHSCWYNPQRLTRSSEVQPTYEIHSLEDLYRILDS